MRPKRHRLSLKVDECKPLDYGGTNDTWSSGKSAAGIKNGGRDLHLSTFQLNLSGFGDTSPCPTV